MACIQLVCMAPLQALAGGVTLRSFGSAKAARIEHSTQAPYERACASSASSASSSAQRASAASDRARPSVERAVV